MNPPAAPVMHQSFDDDLPFRANRALPPVLARAFDPGFRRWAALTRLSVQPNPEALFPVPRHPARMGTSPTAMTTPDSPFNPAPSGALRRRGASA
jgi:hypothetical protein